MDTLLKILQIVPALIGVIKAVEEAFSDSGKGSEKLTMVREIMEASYEGVTEMWPTIEKVVASIVSFANTIGAFKK